MKTTTTKQPASTKAALNRNKAARAKKAELTSTRRTRAAAAPVKKTTSKKQPARKPMNVNPKGSLRAQALVAGAAKTISKRTPRVQKIMRPSRTGVVESIEVKGESYRAQWFFGGLLAGASLFIAGLICGGFMGSW